MGAMIGARGWSASPLGRPQDWPDGLRAAMRNMFNATHPMCIVWGPHALCLYNDGVRSLLGPELHPASLGAQTAELWDESWPTLAPHAARPMHCEGPRWHPCCKAPSTASTLPTLVICGWWDTGHCSA